jgi:hypothetical protein
VLKLLIPIAAGLALQSRTVIADGQTPWADAVASTVAGWDELVDSLRTLPTRLLAKLPESRRNDPQVQQEVGRLALEALASSTLDAIASDGDHPTFVAQINQTLNVGQPNADTIYRLARIRPGGSYRLRGRRGTARIVKLGQIGPTLGEGGTASKQVGATRLYHDVNALHVDRQDRFDVILSPERPPGYKGDWWQLDPSTNKLLLRIVSSDWGKEQDPTISIERIDAPVTRPQLPAADLEARLRRLPAATSAIASLFVDHVQALRRDGYVNKLKVLDASQQGGLAGQFYYEGAYDLRDDEALIVAAKAPVKCAYRSLILTNELYETTDWYNNESSLNDSQARTDKDGVLRIVISAKDPGVPNWLDTAGYRQGLVQGRWTDCDLQPVPSVSKVDLADVRKSLPADTPVVSGEERERLIRARRAAYQQRTLW